MGVFSLKEANFASCRVAFVAEKLVQRRIIIAGTRGALVGVLSFIYRREYESQLQEQPRAERDPQGHEEEGNARSLEAAAGPTNPAAP